jgi:SAM-dependent methyltransferase
MDLGAGTGIVTTHLAQWFRRVIAVEPDAKMAAKIAEQLPLVTIRVKTAEECQQAAGSIDLITIANALHWMDAEQTFANVRKWLKPEGVLAVFDRPLPKVNEEIDTIVRSERHGPWKSHRDPRLQRDLHWQEEVRGAPGFQVIEEARIPHIVPMRPSEYTGFWRSSSYGSAYARTLAEPEKYWRELESRFAAAAKDDIIFVDFSPTLVIARKAQAEPVAASS